MIPKVAVSVLLVFSSLGVGHGASGPCSEPLNNIAVYEGALNTLFYFPAGPNGVKWTVLATTDELPEVDIVNFDDTVEPNYTADYAFNPSGLIIRNATTMADYSSGHQLPTAGLYTAECFGGSLLLSFKFLVVRQGPTCSCSLVNPSNVQLTCSTTYADSSSNPIAAVFTLYVDGYPTASHTPQRTNNPDGYTWDSTSTFTTAYSSSSTYQCGLTFGPPTDVQDPRVVLNAPTFNHYCSVTASDEFRAN